MSQSVTDPRLLGVISAAYESALTPDRWPAVLQQLSAVFRSGFGDVFARTQDFGRYRGLSHGLDAADYQGVFLDKWVARNVWSKSRPVRQAGEVLSTRQMVSREALMRSEMYADYLGPRGLHEGLRLSLYVGEGWVQDISLLRPWSAGPFEQAEQAVARALLPHLQRAAAVTRRLRGAERVAQAGLDALDTMRHAAFLLDQTGRLIRMNRRAEALASEADGLTLGVHGLLGANPSRSAELAALIGGAATFGKAGRAGAGSGRIVLSRPSGRAALTVIAVPVGTENDWSGLRDPAVLLIVTEPDAANGLLAERYGLTPAEMAVAVRLAAGDSLAAIAAAQNRSIATVRTHLARLFAKTGTVRQAALVRLLVQHRVDEATPVF